MNRPPSQRILSTSREKIHLTGATVVQMRFRIGGAAVALILEREGQPLASLELHDVVTLNRDYDQLVLEGARSGPSYDPRTLSPLLDLLGAQIEHVRVEPGGELVLSFAGGWTVCAGVNEDFDSGWELRCGEFVKLI
jgi:hypothetical protein